MDAQKLTTAASRVKAVAMIEYKRPMPLDEPLPLDYFDLPIQDEEGNEIGVWTAEEQYEADLAEWKAALVNPKYNVPRLGVDANDPSIPAHWKSYGTDGQMMGINLSAQVGDLLAVVKAQQAAIEALQAEVTRLKAMVK